MEGYVRVAPLDDFSSGKFTNPSLDLTVATIPLPHYVQVTSIGTASTTVPSETDKRCTKVSVFQKKDGKFFACNTVCPHAGYGLDQGIVMDIEDPMMGKVANVVCPVHGWAFNSLTGTSYNARSIIDIYGVVVAPDPENGGNLTVWCSLLPVNDDIEGPRRDFGGKVLKYGGDDYLWAGDSDFN
ncbi:hypothetical protein M427DRAFT_335392 [Gonapodya prolifera JEL478]|uniref:Rieske domain-containing protein n=1 Tax=Gonapodya prolifera (strain JEL478) TaxID=1344416 RepID=A0A139AEL4_GONPJ|nr:hypothetical protein M427DRAFT_335392 [Gonapodya prolifera JEL478]|eukprot:KXS14863.1 hypothetical protein M427DRAFT_335392 [Gonapodya prolifera JEL478]